MKRTLLLLLLPLLLTSCSNPGTSGGVTLSRGGDDGNEFPYGSCEGQGKNPPGGSTGCGWIHANEESYYIRPGANLSGAHLMYSALSGANLSGANLSGASLYRARLVAATLSGANLSGADLPAANLSGVDLTDADLRGADLSGAELGSANLMGALLHVADLGSVNPIAAVFGPGPDLVYAPPVDAKANSSTICPNGKKWGTTGNNCGF